LLGRNDLAKTVLMDIMAGKIEPDSGTVTWGITITKGYLPSDNSEYFQNGDLDLVNWLRQYSTDKDESFIRGFLGKMLFSGSEALKKSNVLSGGEKVRCMLSKTMLSGANFLLLDGPTAHLDLESIQSVNDGVKRFKGSAIMTCHDHEFIQTTANRIIELENGKVVGDSSDTYEDYMAKNKKKQSLH
jgi:ATPase subunit of ABC transporter with duplicated ATPase domains